MSHFRGHRAERAKHVRNAVRPLLEREPHEHSDFQDTELLEPYWLDTYHQQPGISNPFSGQRPPQTDAQQENEPWHS